MKRLSALSETPKVRALAWVVCIVGLALCLVCGQQAAWVAQRGGYQPNGYTTVVENEVNQVLQTTPKPSPRSIPWPGRTTAAWTLSAT